MFVGFGPKLPTDAVNGNWVLRLWSPFFHVHGREVYWLCRKKQSASTFSNNAFEKALKLGATFRGMNTIKKLAAKIRPVD
jgi:hypothetical protein